MKKIFTILAVIVTACTKSIDYTLPIESYVNEVTCKISSFETDTRTTISSNGSFTWNEGDMLDFWPSLSETFSGKSTNVLFRAQSSGQSVIFHGDGWGLVRGNVYCSSYPYSSSNTVDNIKIDYRYQRQESNNSTSHLGNYDYMYSIETIPDNDAASFHFTRLGSILHFVINIPEEYSTKRFKMMRISSSENIFILKASYSMVGDSICYTPNSRGYIQSIDLNNIVPENNVLDIFMMSAPLDWSDKEIVLDLIDEDNYIYRATVIPSKNITSNKIVTLPLNVDYIGKKDDSYITAYFTGSGYMKILNKVTNVEKIWINDIEVPVSTHYNFDGETNIIKIKLSSDEICRRMFEGSQIDSIFIPSSIEKIGFRAFQSCAALKTVSLPESISEFGLYAFSNCNMLKTFIGDLSLENRWIVKDGEVKYHAPAASWTIIDFKEYNIACKYINLPSSITKDYLPEDSQWYTFRSDADTIIIPPLSDLKYLKIPGKNSKIILPTTVQEKDMELPSNASLIYELEDLLYININCEYIPYNLKTDRYAGRHTISYCKSLDVITLGNDVREIGRFCNNCEMLRVVNLNDGLKKIHEGCFQVLPSLSEIRIPDSVDSIGNWCFVNCTSLKRMYLGSSLKYIGSNFLCSVFSDENSIEELYVSSEIPPQGSPQFLPDNCKVYIPLGTLENYQNDEYWSKFYNLFIEIDFNNFTF